MTFEQENWVTLIVFTYNQENFIGDAVNSALAQDYPNLKVVISDDCSTDKTFENAQKLVGSYSGSHIVELRRNDENLGLINHLNTLMAEVETELVVVAGGDDVSLPNRVSRLMEVYLSSGKPKLLSSTAFKIDEAGCILDGLAPDKVTSVADLNLVIDSLNDIDHRIGLYLGATGAWSMELWRKYGSILYSNCWEDVVMGFRAALENSYQFVDEPLVNYRVNVGLSSRKGRTIAGQIRLRKDKINLKRDLARQRCHDLSVSPKTSDTAIRDRVSKQALIYSIRISYYQSMSYIWNYFKKHPRVTVMQGVGEVKFLLRVLARVSLNFCKSMMRRV